MIIIPGFLTETAAPALMTPGQSLLVHVWLHLPYSQI